MKTIYAAVLLLFVSSCQKKSNFYGISECFNFSHADEPTTKYYFNNLEIIVPKKWKHEKENDNEKSLNIFTTPIDTSNILSLSEEEFNLRYNNFSILTLNDGQLNSQANEYEEGFIRVMKKLNSDQNIKQLESGISSYEDYPIKWIKYLDDSFRKDGLESVVFTTCLIKDDKFIWILGQIFGNELKDERMCHLLEVIKTIELKTLQ